jgi:heme oxygenase (mycobilin-producing)
MGPRPEPQTGTGTVRGDGFVAVSEIDVPEAGAGVLEEAFRRRLGAVDSWPGFRALEVWRDRTDPTRYVMVSWWQDEASFRQYMGSDDHRQSHARVPRGPNRPRPDGFDRFEIVAR